MNKSNHHSGERKEECYFCGCEDELETHHIFPQRFGGGDVDSNLVDLCKSCHSKIERLYDSTFWEKLDISKATSPPIWESLEDVYEINFEIEEDEDLYDYRLDGCAGCERLGPFKRVTHQPSGYKGWECHRCGMEHIHTGAEE